MADQDGSDFLHIDKLGVPLTRRPDDEFKQWHKPRKQWVRESQWGDSIANFVKKYLDLSGRPLAYLTFPGEDFLDVRYLHKIAVKHCFEVEFRGFNDRRTMEGDVSLSEVRDLSNIRAASDIIPDAFETITRNHSIGREQIRRHLGFDVVNLDFCNSVASLDAGTSGSSFDAIMSLVNVQTQQRLDPWMLFVTSRCDPKSVKQTVRQRLASVFHKNCAEQEFERRANDELGLSKDVADLIGGEDAEAVEVAANFKFFGLGFAKWLISMAFPNWEVSTGRLAGYRVYDNDDGCDMLSSVFYFKRENAPHVDGMGLAAPVRAHERRAESKLAISAINKVASFMDIDVHLCSNQEERDRLIHANAELLSEARYDFGKAMSWGRDALWKPEASAVIDTETRILGVPGEIGDLSS